ncbi:MAG TPA: phosphoribosylglycinamide formyltransferase [Desulfohalobiaceae bacterium]|nr:phosphoribosylglycinamide formyltransferase [Desulfohalobiaceae bacterium]
MSFSLGVLLSGSGTNLQAIIDRIEQGSLEAEIAVVISNVHSAYGLERAKAHGIQTAVIEQKGYASRQEHDQAVVARLKQAGVDLVILAGYMRLLSQEFVQAFPQMILNIHPALLPCFPGLNAQKQAVQYGVRLSGATVHFVDEYLDHGPIIIQACSVVNPDDDSQKLSQRILSLEHRIYAQAIQWMAEGRVNVCGRQVWIGEGNNLLADISDLEPCLIVPPIEEGF